MVPAQEVGVQISVKPFAWVVEKRKQAQSHLFKLSLVSVGVSCASILLGILVLVFSGGDVFLGGVAPIWSGVECMLCGTFGYLASTCDIHFDYLAPVRTRYMMVAYLVFCVIGLYVCGNDVGFSVVGAVNCAEENESCSQNAQQELILNIAASVIAVSMLICAFLGVRFFYKYRVLFGVYKPMEALHQKRIPALALLQYSN